MQNTKIRAESMLKHSLEDILDYCSPELKMELVQQELEKQLDKNTFDNKSKKKESISKTEGKSLELLQNFIEDFHKNNTEKIMYLYNTFEKKQEFLNVVSDVSENNQELIETIKNESGQIAKKFEIKNNIIYVNDNPIRVFRRFGKTYRLSKYKENK